MAEFPDPVLLKILHKLSLKSIFRLKAVSKHWLSVISDPVFATRHINTTLPPWTLFSSFSGVSLKDRAIIFHPGFRFSLQLLTPLISLLQEEEASVKLLDSSKGLLLFCSVYNNSHYYVCDLLTAKWVCLPRLLSQPQWGKATILVDNESSNYFVVKVSQLICSSKVIGFEIFSSEFGHWKYVKASFPRRIEFFVMKRHIVHYKDAIHWLVDDCTILAFDLKCYSNEGRLIDLPSDRESKIVGVIGVSCGFLSYVEVADSFVDPSQPQSLGVWFLRDYDAGEWVLEYRIDLNEFWSHDAYLNHTFLRQDSTISPLAFHPFNYDVVFLNRSCHLIYCHLSTRMVEVVECSDEIKDSFYDFEVFPCILPSWPTSVSLIVAMDEFPDHLAELPDPILIKIFQKLPLKSIFRFKVVCKHWFSMISDPLFTQSYTCPINTRNGSSPPWTVFSSSDRLCLQERAVILHPDLLSVGLSLNFLAPIIYSVQHYASIKLLDSSNGLLLLCSIHSSQILDYYVCNPLTMKWVCLPKPLSQPRWVKAAILVNDDSGNYLVVRVANLVCPSKVFYFEIFSSESRQWRYVKVCCRQGINFFVMRRHTVCYNGIIHWLVNNDAIVAFDPQSNSNECRLIKLPSDRMSRIIGIIGVSCGFLRYIEVADTHLEPSQPHSLGVWLLKDYDAGEWFLEYRIELSEFRFSDTSLNQMVPFPGRTTRALVFHPFDYNVVFLNSYFHLFSCQLSTRMVEVMECASQELKSSFYDFEMFPFASWPTPVSKKVPVDTFPDSCPVEVPDQIMVEILQKLPLKSIFRFKSMSKHHLSLISDPFFANSYAHQMNTKRKISQPWAMFSSMDLVGLQERIYVRHPDLASTNFSLQFLGPAFAQEPETCMKLLDSSNGLLLLCSTSNSQILDYYVCNPLTMKWVHLPKPLSQPKWVKAAFLVENDSGKYMVVRVAELIWRSSVFNFEIFSSETGEWRCLKIYCPRRIKFFVKARHTVFYKGSIHWLVDYCTILAFDPKSHANECRFIDLPRDRESTHLGVLGVSCGLLCYMEVSNNYIEEFREQSLGVWILKDAAAAGGWCLEYRIQLSEFGSQGDTFDGRWDPDSAVLTSPLAFHPFDTDVVFLEHRHRLFCCNISMRIVEVVNCESYLNESLYTFEMFPFVLPAWPTPVPPNQLGRLIDVQQIKLLANGPPRCLEKIIVFYDSVVILRWFVMYSCGDKPGLCLLKCEA